jgi:hypothetical protein
MLWQASEHPSIWAPAAAPGYSLPTSGQAVPASTSAIPQFRAQC